MIMLMYFLQNCEVSYHQNEAMTLAQSWKKAQPQEKNKAYRLSVEELELLRHLLDDLLQQSLVRASKSSHGAPALLISRKDEGPRLCVDYCALNVS